MSANSKLMCVDKVPRLLGEDVPTISESSQGVADKIVNESGIEYSRPPKLFSGRFLDNVVYDSYVVISDHLEPGMQSETMEDVREALDALEHNDQNIFIRESFAALKKIIDEQPDYFVR